MQQRVLLEAKLERLIFPVVDLDGISIIEAADFLRVQSQQIDTLELDPANRGVSIVVELGDEDTPVGQKMRAARVNLQLRNVPLQDGARLPRPGRRARCGRPMSLRSVIRPAGTEFGSPDREELPGAAGFPLDLGWGARRRPTWIRSRPSRTTRAAGPAPDRRGGAQAAGGALRRGMLRELQRGEQHAGGAQHAGHAPADRADRRCRRRRPSRCRWWCG